MRKLFFKLPVLFISILLLISPAQSTESGIQYIHNEPNVHVFKFATKRIGHKIKPYVAPQRDSLENVRRDNNFLFVVNGGFFDMETSMPASYVTIDGKIVDNPYDNEALLNLLTDEEMDMVSDRAELRIYENKYHKVRFDIAFHKDLVPEGLKLKHALQAGPMVYPRMDLEKEYFVKYDEKGKVAYDGIDALKRRPRTVAAIKGSDFYIIIFTRRGSVTMQEVYEYCDRMNFDKAMAFDGGGSVGFSYCEDMNIISEDLDKTKTGRKVRSFLVVEN